jgi:hypothetical protein
MTLLDYFAGLAMQGWLCSYGPDTPHPSDSETLALVARNSYDIAIAMVARKQLIEGSDG